MLGRAPGKCWKASANWVIAEERRVFLPCRAPGCLTHPLWGLRALRDVVRHTQMLLGRYPQTHTNAFTWLTQGKLEEGAQNSERCRVRDPGKQCVAEVLGEPGGREPWCSLSRALLHASSHCSVISSAGLWLGASCVLRWVMLVGTHVYVTCRHDIFIVCHCKAKHLFSAVT